MAVGKPPRVGEGRRPLLPPGPWASQSVRLKHGGGRRWGNLLRGKDHDSRWKQAGTAERDTHLRSEGLTLTDGACPWCWERGRRPPGKGEADSFGTDVCSVSPGLGDVPVTGRCQLSHAPGRDF